MLIPKCVPASLGQTEPESNRYLNFWDIFHILSHATEEGLVSRGASYSSPLSTSSSSGIINSSDVHQGNSHWGNPRRYPLGYGRLPLRPTEADDVHKGEVPLKGPPEEVGSVIHAASHQAHATITRWPVREKLSQWVNHVPHSQSLHSSQCNPCIIALQSV